MYTYIYIYTYGKREMSHRKEERIEKRERTLYTYYNDSGNAVLLLFGEREWERVLSRHYAFVLFDVARNLNLPRIFL
jgi:hypothetical protein